VIRVSLKDFIATGEFGQVAIGCTCSDLEAVLGEPECRGGESRKHRRPNIWKYGDVEFFFDRGIDELYLIHIDRFSGEAGIPVGWNYLHLDTWAIREGLPIIDFLHALQAASIQFDRIEKADWNQTVIATASGVKIGFATCLDHLTDSSGLTWIGRRI
jgi:hypothetical protein